MPEPAPVTPWLVGKLRRGCPPGQTLTPDEGQGESVGAYDTARRIYWPTRWPETWATMPGAFRRGYLTRWWGMPCCEHGPVCRECPEVPGPPPTGPRRFYDPETGAQGPMEPL